MTIKVTVTHSQPGYPKNVRVVPYIPTTGEEAAGAPAVELAPGESREWYIHGGLALRVIEADPITPPPSPSVLAGPPPTDPI